MGTVQHTVKWALNHLPRTLLQRLAGWSVPMLGLFYMGRGRECPICGVKRRKFLPYGYVDVRDDALCPRCLSLERHRLLWLWLRLLSSLLSRDPDGTGGKYGLMRLARVS